jgi:hypothetical protein
MKKKRNTNFAKISPPRNMFAYFLEHEYKTLVRQERRGENDGKNNIHVDEECQRERKRAPNKDRNERERERE